MDDINKLLSKLSVAIRIANEKLMCDIGLHAGQVQILSTLWEKDGLSQAEIVRELCVSPPTVNKMVSRLSDGGFTESRKCPHDKRLMRVHLTNKGKKIRPKVEDQWKKLQDIIFCDFGETEKVLLPIVLKKINENLRRGFENKLES